MRTLLLRLLFLVLAVWLVFVVAVYAAMRRTPAEFGSFMKRLPLPAMYLIPFPPLWNHARAGTLQPGDTAPDFDLKRRNETERVRLSAFRGARPVILIFGSYT